MNWSDWSREAVSTAHDQNASWVKQLHLEGAKYRWDLDTATLVLETEHASVVATVCLVGTTSDKLGTFLWSWGNASIPTQHREALETVRRFGEENDLSLLTTPEIAGGKPEALECMCIAARIQRALGTFVDKVGDVGVYFTIMHFQPVTGNCGADG